MENSSNAANFAAGSASELLIGGRLSNLSSAAVGVVRSAAVMQTTTNLCSLDVCVFADNCPPYEGMFRY